MQIAHQIVVLETRMLGFVPVKELPLHKLARRVVTSLTQMRLLLVCAFSICCLRCIVANLCVVAAAKAQVAKQGFKRGEAARSLPTEIEK